jgi:hypothetical protein
MADDTSPQESLTTNLGFLSNVFTPGSSLHPTFLLILDGAFGMLLCVFLGLLFLTRGNVHIFALIGIEGCLWASVKWCVSYFTGNAMRQPANFTFMGRVVYELQKPPPSESAVTADVKLKDE